MASSPATPPPAAGGPHRCYDAIIVGGGPAGSCAATYLARAGKAVLVLERERFPRFHIGESLLPYNRPLFEEMGVLPVLEQANLTRKFGAQFHTANGAHRLKLVFRNGRFTREPMAFQVERATFDTLLLRHAAGCGATVQEEVTVNRFGLESEGVAVEARDAAGNTATFRARFLLDASGRANLTGNHNGLRVVHPRLRKLSLFAHFAGVKLDEGEAGGDTVIVRGDNRWFWIIPLSADKTSVGCVLDQDEYAGLRQPPEPAFDGLWRASRVMTDRLEGAQRLTPVHTASDFSYVNRRLVGERLLRVGDAAGFIDPIFSSGVYLAMVSGRLAARAVLAALDSGGDGRRALVNYETRVRRALASFREMVEGFYTQPFLDLFLQPRDRYDLPAAITALLAGELEGGWRLRWRLRLFFLFTRLQGRGRLVPRLSEKAAGSES